MGYSIFIKAKNKKTSDKMFEFLESNMKSFNQEMHDSSDNYYGLRNSDDLSYRGGKKGNIIGFDYNSGGMEREYINQVLKWMSIKIGVKPREYYYDGEKSKYPVSEKAAIIKEAKNLMKANVERGRTDKDLDGYIDSIEAFKYGFSAVGDPEYKKKGIDFINSEIKRLNKLWLKYK